MSERIFGTDGIRGEAGEGWLALDRVSALGRALGRVLGTDRHARTAVLGHDGRESGPAIERALADGLSEAGFTTTSAGRITTPGLAIVANLERFGLGVMISASHNPARDNGIKVFGLDGAKLSDEAETEIERALLADLTPAAAHPDALRCDTALVERYVRHLVDEAGAGLDLRGLSVVVDCANGAGSDIAPRVLRELGAAITEFAARPDGKNINHECGSTHPQALRGLVASHGADLGIALDGDGDRCILVDERGETVHGDGIMTALARHSASAADSDRRIVATIMSNRGLHRALREVDVEVVTVGVGDRRVVEEMRREGLRLGGEQSGHIVFGEDHFFTGDGIYTALRVLRIMRETGRPLSDLVAAYRPYPQVLLNVPVSRKPPITELVRVEELRVRFEEELGVDGRVLLRYSGTENLLRIMVEGPDLVRIQEQSSELAELVSEELGR